MRRLISVAGILWAVPAAWCHAVLLQSSPQAAAFVAGPEIPVSLRFNSRIDAKRSRLAIVVAGKEEQLELLPQREPDTVAGKIKKAKSGPCRVRWQVLASDGHITRGEIVFQVK